MEVNYKQDMKTNQRGFSTSLFMIDTLRQILDKFYEYNIDIHQFYVDFKSVYDIVNRNQMYHIM